MTVLSADQVAAEFCSVPDFEDVKTLLGRVAIVKANTERTTRLADDLVDNLRRLSRDPGPVRQFHALARLFTGHNPHVGGTVEDDKPYRFAVTFESNDPGIIEVEFTKAYRTRKMTIRVDDVVVFLMTGNSINVARLHTLSAIDWLGVVALFLIERWAGYQSTLALRNCDESRRALERVMGDFAPLPRDYRPVELLSEDVPAGVAQVLPVDAPEPDDIPF